MIGNEVNWNTPLSTWRGTPEPRSPCGCSVNGVLISEEGDARVRFTDYELRRTTSEVASVAMEIGILHAGMIAEREIGGRAHSRGIAFDEDLIHQKISYMRTRGWLDGISEAEAREHFESRTRQIITENARVIEKLADVVLEKRTATYPDLEPVLRKLKPPTSE